MSYLDVFKIKISDFIEYLQNILPADPVISFAGMYLEMTEDKSILLKFYKYVSKYRNEIENRDENFFIKNIGNKNNLEDNKNVIIERLKIHWKKLKDEEKSNIWKYLRTLLILSEKYIDKNNINVSI
jgi:hypothetical protein